MLLQNVAYLILNLHLHMSNNLQDLKFVQTASFNPVGVVPNKDQNSRLPIIVKSQDHERDGRTKKDKKAENQWVIFRNSQVGQAE